MYWMNYSFLLFCASYLSGISNNDTPNSSIQFDPKNLTIWQRTKTAFKILFGRVIDIPKTENALDKTETENNDKNMSNTDENNENSNNNLKETVPNPAQSEEKNENNLEDKSKEDKINKSDKKPKELESEPGKETNIEKNK